MDSSSMGEVTTRVNAIVDAFVDAFLQTAATAAEKINLAAQVAQVQTRMAAFSAVLESIAAQKQVIYDRLQETSGPMQSLLNRHLELLTQQEIAVLERIGIPNDQARPTLEQADEKVYKRDGKRFVPLQEK